ncbi:MAG: hypothetical protein KME16_08120 [Scytolyngbya sp. HA4215-MV1]|nr:hypothetical protein [Scytolyngbya sp. HA4215-MV1]
MPISAQFWDRHQANAEVAQLTEPGDVYKPLVYLRIYHYSNDGTPAIDQEATGQQ